MIGCIVYSLHLSVSLPHYHLAKFNGVIYLFPMKKFSMIMNHW